jgi:acetyl-CoA carboxylase biotin carboxylase subunit
MYGSSVLRRVLVANRGEIAVRIIRACQHEDLETVLAISDADRDSLGARLADRAICIGPASAAESYLHIDRLLAAATATGCDALHPGYGFVSERPELPEACVRAGVTFVGPSADAMRASGDKATARSAARALGVPIGEGSDVLESLEQAHAIATGMGYPVLLKAAAGGGGRGMRRVERPQELASAFAAAGAEARQAFGDGRLFMERFVTSARHVEVQVLADRFGKVIHIGHRDCTLQRRYQKLIEEAPASGLPDAVGEDILASATRLIGSFGYEGAATCEFLVDQQRATAAFLEINARLQVEHPVSEMVTGIDIVREQLRIAGGSPISVDQGAVRIEGHAIEARINAEDPARDFMPSPGTLSRWEPPTGPGVRVDTACYEGLTIPPYYDSLLAKVIAWGPDRPAAVAKLRAALADLHVEGVQTTAQFAVDVLGHSDVQAGNVHTRWVEESFLPTWSPREVAA